MTDVLPLSLATTPPRPLSRASAGTWRHRLALLLMLASGFASLGYQMVWTQQCALWLGHEAAAVLAVVAAFFGGIALGALLLGPGIERSQRPLRWYVACEVLIAAWGLVLWVALSPISQGLLELIGVQPAAWWQWTIAFGGTFVLLLPATAAMGATLPAMERMTAQMQQAQGRSMAAHYASNTLGAVIGVIGANFWLVPQIGLAGTAGLCVGLNLLCAATALSVFPRRADVPAPHTMPLISSQRRAVMNRLAVTGLLGIGYEVMEVRVISQVAEDTVYTFALLLAVYLVGTAAGAAAHQRWLAGKQLEPVRLGDRLLQALATACLLGTLSLWFAEPVQHLVQDTLGTSMTAAIGAEAALAWLAFALPTFVMGALFSHLSAHAQATGISFGRSLGINTLGAALAPPLFGVLLTPVLGTKAALLLIPAGYLALTMRRAWPAPLTWGPMALTLALAWWAPPLRFVTVPEGGQLLSYREGIMAAVSVVEDAEGVARLRINNRQQEGSTSTRLVDARQALLPLLLHPGPRQALFLGLGTGVTSGSAAEDPSLQVDAVELLPEVIDASRHFRRVFDDPAPNPRLHVLAADARRYVRASTTSYDVIVSDNFQPARSGSGALYTVEHFQAVKARLAADGLFCQWLPLHQLDLATLRSIVKSFITVYPGGWAMLASNSLETPVIGLVARRDGHRFDPAVVRHRLAASTWPTSPAAFGIEDEFALLGSMVAGPSALAHFAAPAQANTDDHPVVTYQAPRITYAPDSLPRERLSALLDEMSVQPSELLVTRTADERSWAHRLSAYWAARRVFIEAGQQIRPSADVQDMLSQVRAPLLSVLRISPDFRPAYDPLLRMAGALARSDALSARALLAELVQRQPMRPEAKLALSQLEVPNSTAPAFSTRP